MPLRSLRRDVVETARALHERGWVANHDGNVTARDPDRAALIATPTATSKRRVDEASLIEVDLAGKPIGSGKVFGEIGLHLVVYERRPDVGAVVHAHPPHATAIACSRDNPIERPFIAEALVSLGPAIPKLAFAAPGDAARKELGPWCDLVDAALLGNHGVIAWGKDCETALLRLELVEHLARVALLALPLGGVQPLPESLLAPMMQARARASIGRVADRAVELAERLARGEKLAPATQAAAPATAATAAAPVKGAKPVVACAPAPHSATPTIAPGGDRRRELLEVVRDEVVRALREEP